MPLCFICFGVILIFLIFGTVSNLQLNKFSKGLFLLFVVTEICSFFAKDLVFNGISVCYYIPLIFLILFFFANFRSINILLTFSIGIFLASGLIAIGYIDLSLMQFLEKFFLPVSLIVGVVPIVFLRKASEQLLAIIISYSIFIMVLTIKKVDGINLANVMLLNLFSISFLTNFALNVIIKNFIPRRKENVEKITA